MPIHDYICKKCKTSKERVVSFKKADDEVDCVDTKCKGKMVKSSKLVRGTAVILKGRFH